MFTFKTSSKLVVKREGQNIKKQQQQQQQQKCPSAKSL